MAFLCWFSLHFSDFWRNQAPFCVVNCQSVQRFLLCRLVLLLSLQHFEDTVIVCGDTFSCLSKSVVFLVTWIVSFPHMLIPARLLLFKKNGVKEKLSYTGLVGAGGMGLKKRCVTTSAEQGFVRDWGTMARGALKPLHRRAGRPWNRVLRGLCKPGALIEAGVRVGEHTGLPGKGLQDLTSSAVLPFLLWASSWG